MLSYCLLALDRDSDKILFETLYYKYEKDIYKRIYHLLQNREDSEDVMQNTWLFVAKNLDFYRTKDEKTIRAYIMRIAKNQAITRYHEKKKDEAFCCKLEDEALPAENSETLLFRLCDKMDISVICECIDALDEKYSDILNYFYLHEHSVKEISEAFHMKESTVRSRLTRGRDQLIKRLERRNLNVK